MNSAKHSNNTNAFYSLSINRGQNNTSKFILQGQHYLATKSEEDSKRKLQANIPDKNRCKNSQQNIHKLNSVIPSNDPIL